MLQESSCSKSSSQLIGYSTSVRIQWHASKFERRHGGIFGGKHCSIYTECQSFHMPLCFPTTRVQHHAQLLGSCRSLLLATPAGAISQHQSAKNWCSRLLTPFVPKTSLTLILQLFCSRECCCALVHDALLACCSQGCLPGGSAQKRTAASGAPPLIDCHACSCCPMNTYTVPWCPLPELC